MEPHTIEHNLQGRYVDSNALFKIRLDLTNEHAQFHATEPIYGDEQPPLSEVDSDEAADDVQQENVEEVKNDFVVNDQEDEQNVNQQVIQAS